MRPIDRLILDVVRCIDCGAGYGACSCWERKDADREEKKSAFVEAETARLLALPDAEFEAECRALGVWPIEPDPTTQKARR